MSGLNRVNPIQPGVIWLIDRWVQLALCSLLFKATTVTTPSKFMKYLSKLSYLFSARTAPFMLGNPRSGRTHLWLLSVHFLSPWQISYNTQTLNMNMKGGHFWPSEEIEGGHFGRWGDWSGSFWRSGEIEGGHPCLDSLFARFFFQTAP